MTPNAQFSHNPSKIKPKGKKTARVSINPYSLHVVQTFIDIAICMRKKEPPSIPEENAYEH